MPYLRYNGPLPQVEVGGFGHFVSGEEKFVDVVTAGAFRDPKCAREGWSVRDDDSVSGDQSPAREMSDRDRVADDATHVTSTNLH